MTDYVVLHREAPVVEQDSGPNEWTHVLVQEAASADAAIRKVAATKSLSGEFVAVPSSSWKPRRVQVQQTVKVDIA